jgi:electron transport complex protein RnfD
MAFWIASSPHNHVQSATPNLMRLVILATLPGIFAQWYFFGWGNLIQISIAVTVALLTEVFILSLREKNISEQVFDGSAILTGVLLGISLPPLAPWWIVVMGSIFAIAIVKQLYGGLGQNPFNPAMAAYVMLLISFPLQMTSWLPPAPLAGQELTFFNTLWTILSGYSSEGYSLEQLSLGLDGITMATPLDTLKTDITMGIIVPESMTKPIFGGFVGIGWEWVNAGFLFGGIFLLAKKAISYHVPLSFLGSLFICSFIGYILSPDSTASTLFHWFSGACMLGAFFILTDPVSGATSVKGRLIFGALAGVLVYLIRTFGGYPDAIAFATLLCNMAAPLIDQYTKPRTFGHTGSN